MQKTIIRKTKVEKEISEAFKIHFDRVQIPIFDIPKIYEKARKSIELGFTADHAVKAISLEYIK